MTDVPPAPLTGPPPEWRGPGNGRVWNVRHLVLRDPERFVDVWGRA